MWNQIKASTDIDILKDADAVIKVFACVYDISNSIARMGE